MFYVYLTIAVLLLVVIGLVVVFTRKTTTATATDTTTETTPDDRASGDVPIGSDPLLQLEQQIQDLELAIQYAQESLVTLAA